MEPLPSPLRKPNRAELVTQRKQIRRSLRSLVRGLTFSLAITIALVVRHSGCHATEGQQNGGTLQYGDQITATIQDDEYRHLYAFHGNENDVVSIRMTQTSGNLDAFLVLTDTDGEILAISDDDGNSVNDEISFKRLPAEGRYFVIATRFGQEYGTTTGNYRLELERLGAEAQQNAVLQYGDSVFGRITASSPMTFYFLRAQRGDVISAEMRRTSGDLDPLLELATTEGNILVSNDDDPNAAGTLDAGIINYIVQNDGVYLIVATRFGHDTGDTEGSYVLSVTRTPYDALGETPQIPYLIDYGMTVAGSITNTAQARYFRFDGRRGDVITALLASDSGNLDPLLRIVDNNQIELAQNDDSDGTRDAQIVAYTLPETGTYYLVATRSDQRNGDSTGDFTLVFNGRPGIVGGQALEIVYGATVSGQIDSQNVSEEYIFFGQEDDEIRVNMNRASGDLDPLLTLYDSNRKQIAFDDDSGNDKNAFIEQFVLPNDDVYLLVASRFEREQGTTTGAYILSLDLVRSGN